MDGSLGHDEENNTDDSLDIEEAIAFAAAAQQRLDNDNASMDQSLNRSVARSLDDMDGSFGPTQTVNKIEVGMGHQVPETLLPGQRHNERRTDDNQFHSIKHSSKKASSDEPTRIEESPYGMTETDNEGSSSSNSNDSNPVSTNDDDSSDSDSDDSSSSSSSGSDSGSSSDSSVEGTGVDDHQSYFTSGTAGKGLLSNPAEFQRQKQIRIEVEELVRELVPEEIDNLDAMFTQFAGREEELLNTLHTMKERRLKVRARAAVHKGKARPPPREHEQPGYKRNPSLRGQFSGTDTSAQILSASIPDSSDDTGSYSSSSSESSSSSSSSYSSSDSGSGS